MSAAASLQRVTLGSIRQPLAASCMSASRKRSHTVTTGFPQRSRMASTSCAYRWHLQPLSNRKPPGLVQVTVDASRSPIPAFLFFK